MKKLMIYLALLLPALAMAQSGAYSLKVKLVEEDEFTKAQLSSPISPSKVVDVKNGSFEFTGTLEDPVLVYLTVDRKVEGKRKSEGYWMYLEPGNIGLESATSFLADAKVTGSKINLEYNKLKAALKPIEDRKKLFETKLKALTDGKETNEHLEVGVAKAREAIEADFAKVYLRCYQENLDNFLGLAALDKYVGKVVNYRATVPLFEKLSPEVKATKDGKKMAAHLAVLKKTDIGTKAIDFTQLDVNGKPVKLSDFKGKYVLVDFWASWCVPCREENPNVLKAYNNYHSKGLEILGVSIDTENLKEKWLNAIEADQLPWKQVSDLKSPNEAGKIYGVNAIPQNVLVGPDGKVLAKNLTGNALHIKLAEIFDKKS